MEIITKSAKETANLGQKLAADLKSGTVIALYGDLGSGKTTFVQGLAFGFGIKERILSPTFVLMREYVICNTKHVTRNMYPVSRITYPVSRLYHVDLYRIVDKNDIESLGLQEIWFDPNNVVAIEWPEKIEKILPKNHIKIYFEYVSENERKIKIISN